MKKVRLAVLGMGRQGQIHSKNIAYMIPEAELVCVSDVSIDLARNCPVEGVELYDDYREVINRKDLDGVVIATSTNSHPEVIRAAATRGLHVLCEKPIASELGEIDQLLASVQSAGIKFMVAFNRRFDATFAGVRELVANGTLGSPMIVNITSRDPEPPSIEYLKVSGGIFFDTAVHDFDMARYLSGLEIDELYATGGALMDERIADLDDLDTTMIALRFSNGAVGSINNSRRTGFGYDQRVEVFGTKATAFGNNESRTEVEMIDAAGTHHDVPPYFNVERYSKAFLAEMQAFVECLRTNAEPPVTGRDGRIAVALSLAARTSFDEHRPVKLAEIG